MAEPATVFDPTDDEALTRAIAQARAQAAAGQTIPLSDVASWLDTWGTSDECSALSWKSSLPRPPLLT